MNLVPRCPRCGGGHIRMPLADALSDVPSGYALDARLVLVCCADCDALVKLSDAVVAA